MPGLVARKCGMTRIFEADGRAIPVTVLEVLPHRVTQVNKKDNGYSIQITKGVVKPQRLNKAQLGSFAKANVVPGEGLWEFGISASEAESYTVGQEFDVEIFKVGQMVDVSGRTKGRGFTGCITRHNFSSQRASHGNSLSHNAPGSIGQNQSPGKVFKGKKMAGHYGDENRTVQNLQVIRVDKDRCMLLVSGAVPGAPGANVIVLPAIKGGE